MEDTIIGTFFWATAIRVFDKYFIPPGNANAIQEMVDVAVGEWRSEDFAVFRVMNYKSRRSAWFIGTVEYRIDEFGNIFNPVDFKLMFIIGS